MAKIKKYEGGALGIGSSAGAAGAANGLGGMPGGIDIGGMASSLGTNIAAIINANKKQDPTGKPYKKGSKKLKTYEDGSQGLLDTNSKFRQGLDWGLTGASFIPGVGYAANLVGSGLDLYDAYNAKNPEDRAAALASAGMGLIPGGRLMRGALRATRATKTLARVAPKVANKVDPSYVNKLVNNKTIKEFRSPSQIADAAQEAASSAKGTFTSLWDKTKGAFSGNSLQPSFKKGTKNINSNNMKMKKYDDGAKSAQLSRYQKLDKKLGGFLPGGLSRAEVKAMKEYKPAVEGSPLRRPSAEGSVGPMAEGYKAAPDLSKPVGMMTDIKRYTNPANMPPTSPAASSSSSPKETAAKPKVNFKGSSKKALGGGYKMYEDMNTDQRRQYREGMASGKDFTVTVADKYGKNRELKYKAASSDAAALSKKRNAEYDKRYQADLIKKMPDTKNLEAHDHLLHWQDKALDNAKKQFDARHKNNVTPTPNPTPKKEDGDNSGLFWGLGTAALGAAGYAAAKKWLKKKVPGAGVAVEAAEEVAPRVIKKVKDVAPKAQEAAQKVFNFLNIKRLEGAAKQEQKRLGGRKPQLLLGSGK